MEKKTNGLHLVGKTKEVLSAKRWIERVSEAFHKRGLPMHQFILVPEKKDKSKVR